MTITFVNQPCFVSYHYAILLSLFWKSHLMLIIQWLLVLGTCSNFDYFYIDFTLLTLWKIKCSLSMAAWMFLCLTWETKAMLLHTLLRVCIYLRYITCSFVKWLGFCLQAFQCFCWVLQVVFPNLSNEDQYMIRFLLFLAPLLFSLPDTEMHYHIRTFYI